MALIELMVVAAVLSLILTALCVTFFAVEREWQSQHGEQEALMAAIQAAPEALGIGLANPKAVCTFVQERFGCLLSR